MRHLDDFEKDNLIIDEHAIIHKIKQKDEMSFIYIVNKYKIKLMRLCFSYTTDQQEAEDLSQQIFISFYNSIENFREDCLLSTYLYRICISKCISYKRKKSIKSFLLGLTYDGKSHDESLNIDDKNYIRDCINKLSCELKKCIVLYYYCDLSYKEIGKIINISEKAVEGRIYRAKQKLKHELEKGGFCCAKQI